MTPLSAPVRQSRQADGRSELLVVTGLQAEARIAAGPRVATVCGGGRPHLHASILQAIGPQTRGILSFGIAGGLSPTLPPGSLVIATTIVDGEDSFAADAVWASRLAALLVDAVSGRIAGIDVPAGNAATKAPLFEQSGAVAVDMESHVAARIAFERGLPFAAIRVVSDPYDRALPPAALVGMAADGSSDIGAVLASLIARPSQLPALIQTAFDAGRALRMLRRSRRSLGSVFECEFD